MTIRGAAFIGIAPWSGAGIFALLGEAAATVIVLGFFAVDTLRNAPETFGAILGMTLLAVALDFIWKRQRPEPAPADSAPAGLQ